VCTHVFVNIDGNVEYDDPLLEVGITLLYWSIAIGLANVQVLSSL